MAPVDFRQPLTATARTSFVRTNSNQSPDATLADNRGSIMVEYTVLLTLVAIGLALAMVSLGVPLVQMYLNQRTVLLLPVP
jgi:Flp pilus assembly pilin Flp